MSFARKVVEATESIPSISRASIGKRIEVEPGYDRTFGDKTYEYAAVLEFKDRDALRSYLTDPRHDELGVMFWNLCEGTVICEVEYASGSAEEAARMLAS